MFRVNTSRRLVRDLRFQARVAGQDASHLAGDCANPVELHLFGYPDPIAVKLGMEDDSASAQRLFARCRKCGPCLAHRSYLWRCRAVEECRVANRTWFGTLTLAPDHAFRFQAMAARRYERRACEGVASLSPAERFAIVAKAVSPELTKWLKRVREKTGARLRYLLVCEAHKSGIPHWHLLLHEMDFRSAPKAVLEEQWRLGFSHWRLVPRGDARAAGYAAKYLAKSAQTRVRASQHYGSALPDLTEASKVLADALRKRAVDKGTDSASREGNVGLY